jgi:hypothetical protein
MASESFIARVKKPFVFQNKSAEVKIRSASSRAGLAEKVHVSVLHQLEQCLTIVPESVVGGARKGFYNPVQFSCVCPFSPHAKLRPEQKNSMRNKRASVFESQFPRAGQGLPGTPCSGCTMLFPRAASGRRAGARGRCRPGEESPPDGDAQLAATPPADAGVARSWPRRTPPPGCGNQRWLLLQDLQGAAWRFLVEPPLNFALQNQRSP